MSRLMDSYFQLVLVIGLAGVAFLLALTIQTFARIFITSFRQARHRRRRRDRLTAADLLKYDETRDR